MPLLFWLYVCMFVCVGGEFVCVCVRMCRPCCRTQYFGGQDRKLQISTKKLKYYTKNGQQSFAILHPMIA